MGDGGNFQCTPLCPWGAFRCLKNALIVRRQGRRMVPYCTWIGDTCIGPKCQFASCVRHAMLPDGRCRLKLEKAGLVRRARRDVVEEALRMEGEMGRVREKLKKLGPRFDQLE